MVFNVFIRVILATSLLTGIVATKDDERPTLRLFSEHLEKPFPKSPARSRTCRVHPRGSGRDDAANILKAVTKCNNGGRVVIEGDITIASLLDLTFLNGIDIAILGTINFTDDVNYWVDHTFKYAFQYSSAFWRFGGKDVNIYGNGAGNINGSGQTWYAEVAVNSTLLRPIRFVLDGVEGGSLSGLTFLNSPNVSQRNRPYATPADPPAVVHSHSQQFRCHRQ